MEEHMEQSRVVGIKQVKKALREGRALEVILADDADPALTEPLEAACREAGVKVTAHCVHEGARARLRDFGRRCLRGICPLSAFLLVPTEYFRIFPGYYNIAGNSNILRKEEHYAYF